MKKVLFVSLALAGLSILSAARANTIAQKFSADPLQNGWQIFGDTNLFQWDSTKHNLVVTWDSSQPNSYFYHPLGTIYSKTNDFLITFDLRLNDIAIGTTPGEPFTFEIAIGLMHTTTATNGNYFRGYGYFPDIVEFDYFPNDLNDYGATVSTLMILVTDKLFQRRLHRSARTGNQHALSCRDGLYRHGPDLAHHHGG